MPVCLRVYFVEYKKSTEKRKRCVRGLAKGKTKRAVYF